MEKSQKQADIGKAVRRRYLPAIDLLAEQIARELKVDLEILILKKLGFTFWLKNSPHFLLSLSLITGITGIAVNHFSENAQPINQEIQNGTQIRSGK